MRLLCLTHDVDVEGNWLVSIQVCFMNRDGVKCLSFVGCVHLALLRLITHVLHLHLLEGTVYCIQN